MGLKAFVTIVSLWLFIFPVVGAMPALPIYPTRSSEVGTSSSASLSTPDDLPLPIKMPEPSRDTADAGSSVLNVVSPFPYVLNEEAAAQYWATAFAGVVAETAAPPASDSVSVIAMHVEQAEDHSARDATIASGVESASAAEYGPTAEEEAYSSSYATANSSPSRTVEEDMRSSTLQSPMSSELFEDNSKEMSYGSGRYSKYLGDSKYEHEESDSTFSGDAGSGNANDGYAAVKEIDENEWLEQGRESGEFGTDGSGASGAHEEADLVTEIVAEDQAASGETIPEDEVSSVYAGPNSLLDKESELAGINQMLREVEQKLRMALALLQHQVSEASPPATNDIREATDAEDAHHTAEKQSYAELLHAHN